MSAVAPLLAAFLMVFAGIHPTANAPDPSWLCGAYDDADSDTLISGLGAATSHPFSGDVTVRVPLVARMLVFVGGMIPGGVGLLPRRAFFALGVRGPPLLLAGLRPPSPCTDAMRSAGSSFRPRWNLCSWPI